MARLLKDGLLGLEGVNQYLNCTYKVGELGHVYTWLPVLTYERQYRILQSRLSFAWGTDISHLRATTLVPKPVNNTASYVNGKASRNNSQQRKFGGSEVSRRIISIPSTICVGISTVGVALGPTVNLLPNVAFLIVLINTWPHSIMHSQKHKHPLSYNTASGTAHS